MTYAQALVLGSKLYAEWERLNDELLHRPLRTGEFPTPEEWEADRERREAWEAIADEYGIDPYKLKPIRW